MKSKRLVIADFFGGLTGVMKLQRLGGDRMSKPEKGVLFWTLRVDTDGVLETRRRFI
jgi:hypothetical protein